MSFGFSVGDIIAVATLAKETFVKTKNACGDHEQLTREAQGFYINLELLCVEVSRPESIFNRNDIDDNAPIGTTVSKLDFDSYKALLVEISNVLEKYDQLSIDNKLGFRKALKMVSFGNWKVQDLENACRKLYQATQLIQAFILIITAGSMRRIEFQGRKTQEISITTIEELRKLTQIVEQCMSTQGVQGLGEPTKLLASQSAKSLLENSSAGLSPQLQPADRSLSDKESKSSSALLEPPPRTEYRIGSLSLVIRRPSKPKSKAPTETLSVKDLVRRTSGRRDPWESESEKESGEKNSPKKKGGIFRWTKHTKTAEDDDDNDDSDPESEVDALFANPAQSHRRTRRHTTKPRNDSPPPPPHFDFHSATDLENEKTKSASKLGRVLGFGRNKNKRDASEDESEPSFILDSAQDSEDESAKRGGKFGRLFGGRDKHKEKASEDFYPPPRNDPSPPLPGLEDDEDDEEKPARKSRGLFGGRDMHKHRAREDVYRFHNDPRPGFEDEEDKPAKKFGGLFSGRKNQASDDESEPSFVFNSASDSSGRSKKKQGKKIGGFWGRDKKKKKKGSDGDSP